MNYLSLDIGEKRIGTAISKNNIVAPFGIIRNDNLNQAIGEIINICRKDDIVKIIIGMPKQKDSVQVDKIHKFAIELTKKINLPIEYIDETLSSKEAERLLSETKLNYKTKKYKEEIDKMAARFILEQYLNK